ncbi:tachykinin-4 [Ctenodactylus gundi]
MLPCLTLPLLMGLSVSTVAGHSGEELPLRAEAEPWVTVTIEGTIPNVQLQLQEVKRGKTRQFFGLMGKRVGGYQLEQMIQGLLGKRELATKGRQEPVAGSKGITSK